jgi:hypothetical protein
MGCLNSNKNFDHWFGNIHFSGVCNRSCYFCIGQHMMGLDSYNNLATWPLNGLDTFVEKCQEHNVKEVNLTGTNTDPALYLYLDQLCAYLRRNIPGVVLGIRTNGALLEKRSKAMKLFDKGSISVTSFNKEIYNKTMGQGCPPDIRAFMNEDCKLSENLKLNIVLCPEILEGDDCCDLLNTLTTLNFLAFERSMLKNNPSFKLKVNLREPYGQPHIGDPMPGFGFIRTGERLGMSQYNFGWLDVTYWDVHYVEVESVNLYANGNVSEDYPVTRGYDSELGVVRDQSNWDKPGRHVEQWVNTPKLRLKVI